MNKTEPHVKSTNKMGDEIFFVRTNDSTETKPIPFNFSCSVHRRQLAQQVFLNLPFVVHEQRNQPLIVTTIKAAKDAAYVLRVIFEHCEREVSPHLAAWTQVELEHFFYTHMLKQTETDEQDAELYSAARLNDYIAMFNFSHQFMLEGKCQDGLSFPITSNITKQLYKRRLTEMGVSFSQWKAGKRIKSIPLGIAATVLTKAIELLESQATQISSCLYRAYRQHNPYLSHSWFPTATRPTDIVQHSLQKKKDPTGILDEFQKHGLSAVTQLPWSSRTAFNDYQTLVQGAALSVMFAQGGHRFSELTSTISTESKTLQGKMFVRQSLNKEHKGIRVFRPLASLSAATANTLWGLSYIDAKKVALPLFHNTFKGSAKNLTPLDDVGYKYMALIHRLNKFYRSCVIPHLPEAAASHPKLTFHQFRHTFAEFVLRRFDEDVHENLREHFMHLSDYSTRIYEEEKLTKEMLFQLEIDYLREIIGKVADGKLDERYWGPAFKRLQGLVKQIKFLSASEAGDWYDEVVDKIERFAVFEWGFCVLFRQSKGEARCHDSVSGLPDVDGQASAGRCTGCPNNMGNNIQRNNLIRIAAAHSAISDNHPIRAIGKMSRDISEQISRRIGA
ncbi:hypothetical protein ACIPM0_15920 [Pseudomonas sichuanensis]|uniref:hypothetical protein n=1 Tax=Pseudomonas sichuanensis TaxID=2213015 RepID=UPI00382D4677